MDQNIEAQDLLDHQTRQLKRQLYISEKLVQARNEEKEKLDSQTEVVNVLTKTLRGTKSISSHSFY